ncbi:hypothetical protein DFQ26_006221 [Actinomortierella ambigua]|nr:hypothetical protein DFQ26_006221 [Actinomortierella ambigua]
MAILALSKPVTTKDFCGERTDYSQVDFSSQDQHVAACPPSEAQSIARLSSYLTYPFVGDRIAQLRTIFTWIARNIRYNMAGFMSGNLGDNSAEAVLRSRTGVCAGYSNLFMALSAQQHLGVTMVVGDARGYGFKVGTRDRGGKHAWNAVEVNGEWLLIDSTWGSGGATSDDRGPRTGSGGDDPFNPYYFLVRPEQMIYTHWPTKAEEQFLDPPVCEDLYLELPAIQWAAWSIGLWPTAPYTSQVLHADDDFVELAIRMAPPTASSSSINNTPTIPRLKLAWNGSSLSNDELPIGPFWYAEDEETGDIVYSFRFFCPSQGTGELSVFAFVDGGAGGGVMKANRSLLYRVVNEGTGARFQPPLQQSPVAATPVVVVEPWTALIASGVQQKVCVRVVQTASKNSRSKAPTFVVIQNGGGGIMLRHPPTMLKEVKPGWFEVVRTFSPGEYFIGSSNGSALMPTSFSVLTSFNVK